MQKFLTTIVVLVASILILAISAVPVIAQVTVFTAVINAGQENPPSNSQAFGGAFVTFNEGTGELCFSISYDETRLTSLETNAHFHASAPPGTNAGVIIQLPTPDNPKNGCVTPELSPEQIADLFNGLWYINIHTQNNPGGEIRGQVLSSFFVF